MIQAQLPDGQLVEFPDDTTPEEMTAALNAQFPAEPRDTTFGEKVAGGALSLASGTMGATQGVVDLIDLVVPDFIDAPVTKPASAQFQRGQDAAQALKPDAFKAKEREGFLDIGPEGDIEGVQLPSLEHAANLVGGTLPQLPFFLAGGFGAGKLIQGATKLPKIISQALGLGTTNAALIAPGQAKDTEREVLAAGGTPEEARKAGQVSGAFTALLTFATGTAGGGIAAKLGAGSGSLVTALAKGFVAEGPFEGLEEGGQAIIADLAAGRDPDLVSAFDQFLSATALGGAPGSAIAGFEQRATRGTDIPAPATDALDLQQDLNAKIDEARETIAGTSPAIQEIDKQAAARQQERPVVEVAPEVAPIEVQPTQEPEESRTVATEPVIEPEIELPAHVTEEVPPEVQAGETQITEPAAEIFDANKVTKEERVAHQTEVLERGDSVPGKNPNYIHRAFKKGNMFEAVELEDGTWRTRSKPNHLAQFSEWAPAENVDTLGLTRIGKDSGIIQITGEGKFKISEPFKAPKELRGPPDLLQELAEGPQLNKQAFISEFGLVPADLKEVRPIPGNLRGVFVDEGGLTPDGLREFMIESGEFLNPESELTPDKQDHRDAFAVLEKALAGERVVAKSLDIEESDFQAAVEQAELEAEKEFQDEQDRKEFGEEYLFGYDSDPGISDEDAMALDDERFERERVHVDEGTAPQGVSTRPGISQETGVETPARPAPEPRQGEQGTEPTQGADLELETPAQPEKEPEPGEFTTSLKHDVIEEERLARGEEPLLSEAKKSNPETMEDAEAALEKNPDRADEIIDEILSGSGDTISAVDSGVLLLEKVRVMNERFKASERAINEELSEDNRLTAQGKWRDLEAKIELIEQAARAAGTQAGRNLQFRKVLIQNDYSLAAMESKARAVRMRPLTPEESTLIEKQFKEIADITKRLEESLQKTRDLEDKAKSSQVVSELAKQFADRNVPKSNREWLDRMNRRADDSRAWLKSNMGRTSAGVDPTAYFHLVRVGASHVANGAVKLTDWVKAMKSDLGNRLWGEIEPQAETIFYEAKEQAESEAVEADQPAPVQGEILHKPTAIESIVLDASTDAAAGLDLTHKTVYELAKAHVLQGITEESAVMAAVHQDLLPFFPEKTERDVRRAFSEYGQAKFPSRQADKVTLRELRVLVRLQESIDRLTERLSPLRTGLQRDKATKKIRDKQRELNARQKEFESTHPSTSPDRLASVNEARMTRLRNQIADLEEQLKTGKKPEKGKPAEATPEVIKMTQERDALKEKLRQIEEAKNPPATPEEKYNITRGKQLRRQFKEVQARLKANDYAKRTRPVPPKLNKENQDLAFELNKAKGDFIIAQYKWELDQASKVRKAFRFTGRLLSFSRSIKTSLDLSATLRQAGIPLLAHPSKFARKMFMAQMRALRNEATAHAMQEQIFNHPKTPFAIKAGLFLNKQDAAKPSEKEEIYMDEWVKRTPGVAASARAYTVGLNSIRISYFNHLVETLGRGGQVTEAEAKHIAYWVNRATGRGSLAQFGDTGGTTVFFAPRWVQSRFAVLSGYPIFGAPSPRLRKMIAKEYARSMTGFLGLAAMVGGAFALTAGDDDEVSFSLDPKSTDFMKIKVGDTRIDLTAAISSPIVFLTRILGGKKTTQSGDVVSLVEDVKYGGDTIPIILLRYLRSKLSPPIAAAINARQGENVVGESTTPAGEVVGLITPLALADMYDAMLAQGIPKGTALTMIAILGGATNTYANQEAKKEKARRPKTRVKRQKRERR